MSSKEVVAARKAIEEKSSSLEEYFRGIDEVRYIYDFSLLHRRSKQSVLTWTEGRWFFKYHNRKSKFRNAYRDFTHYIIFSHATIEYLSAKLIQESIGAKENKEVFEKIIDDLGQYEREKRLKQMGVLDSGKLEDNLNRIRGLRNDLVHNMRAQFDIEQRGHPADIIDRVWNTISSLCKLVYAQNLEEITSYLAECYREPPRLSIGDLPTAKLVDEYQYAKNEGMRLEEYNEEFKNRGFDPEKAPVYNSIEYIENLDHLWMGGGPPEAYSGMGLVEVIKFNIPGSAMRAEEKQYTVEFKINESPKFLTPPFTEEEPNLEEVEYYVVLIIGGEVYDVRPNTSSGRAKKEQIVPGDKQRVNFSAEIHEEGTHEVKFGIHVYSTNDRIEWIEDPPAFGEVEVFNP